MFLCRKNSFYLLADDKHMCKSKLKEMDFSKVEDFKCVLWISDSDKEC